MADGSGHARIIKAEEKGTDVALATHLLHDAHRNDYDTAVIISNDSDLIPPIHVVREDLHRLVGLICPHRHVSSALAREVDFYKQIRTGVLRVSQFPEVLTDGRGEFHKPPSL